MALLEVCDKSIENYLKTTTITFLRSGDDDSQLTEKQIFSKLVYVPT